MLSLSNGGGIHRSLTSPLCKDKDFVGDFFTLFRVLRVLPSSVRKTLLGWNESEWVLCG